MKTRFAILSAFVLGAAAGALAGCQTYDFEPVEPLAISQTSKVVPIAGRKARPNLMLLVDKSGSMNDPINPQAPECQVSGSPCSGNCPSGCATRWSELKKAMNTFLTTYGTVGRMGLLFFPNSGGDGCIPPTLSDIAVQIPNSKDVEADLKAAANAINTAIQGTFPTGGTPTGASLQALSNYTPLLDNSEQRAQFIVVLTDGLPNCNPNNPNNFGTNPSACRCTLAQGNCNGFPTEGCLDEANTVLQVQSLFSRGIKTIVIGFGADLNNGDGLEVLNAMANAGGFPRACPDGTDAECGGAVGSCNVSNHTCTQMFYQAANGDDLAKALTDIQRRVGVDPCLYTLDATPSDPSLLTVIVDGQTTTTGADTWVYDTSSGQPKVKFQGALCTRLANATENEPVNVEFRVVEGL